MDYDLLLAFKAQKMLKKSNSSRLKLNNDNLLKINKYVLKYRSPFYLLLIKLTSNIQHFN